MIPKAVWIDDNTAALFEKKPFLREKVNEVLIIINAIFLKTDLSIDLRTFNGYDGKSSSFETQILLTFNINKPSLSLNKKLNSVIDICDNLINSYWKYEIYILSATL